MLNKRAKEEEEGETDDVYGIVLGANLEHSLELKD